MGALVIRVGFGNTLYYYIGLHRAIGFLRNEISSDCGFYAAAKR